MYVNRKTRRWLSVLLLAVLAFAQANVALAACQIDRAEMGAAAAAPMDGGCDCRMAADGAAPLDNACVVHCTADLQVFGYAVALVREARDVLVFVLRLPLAAPVAARSSDQSPPGSPPARIMLHSFLI